MFVPRAVAIQSEIFHFFGHKRDTGMGLKIKCKHIS